jgi:hypothetical protein
MYDDSSKRILKYLANSGIDSLAGTGVCVADDKFTTYPQFDIEMGRVPAPVDGSLEHYVVYHSGNLNQGFALAFGIYHFLTIGLSAIHDYAARHLSKSNQVMKFIDYLGEDAQRTNVFAGITAAALVSFLELAGIQNKGSMDDVPAGIAGSFLHTALMYALTKNKEKMLAPNHLLSSENG